MAQETRKEKVLTKEEREEAIQFLQQKDLRNKTNEKIGESGVIGEGDCIILMVIFRRLLIGRMVNWVVGIYFMIHLA